MELREGDAELGALQHGQVGGVFRVQHVDQLHNVKHSFQLRLHRLCDAGCDENRQLVQRRDPLQRVRYHQGAQRVRVICG